MGEPEVVHAAVPKGASILELGCGTGRILRPLAGLGHSVLGVDESAAMLARVADLPTVCSPIETLRLDRGFDAVLLASTMLNTEPAQRHAFLEACRRHVYPQGVVIQQTAPSWFDTAAPTQAEHDRIRTHEFGRYRIGEEELVADLAAAGLRFDRWRRPVRSPRRARWDRWA